MARLIQPAGRKGCDALAGCCCSRRWPDGLSWAFIKSKLREGRGMVDSEGIFRAGHRPSQFAEDIGTSIRRHPVALVRGEREADAYLKKGSYHHHHGASGAP